MTEPIESLRVGVYVIPLDAPESDGTFTWTDTTVVVAEPSAAGHTGLGFTYGTPACARLIRDLLEPIVLGASALDVTGTWMRMVRSIRNVGRPGIASMAIAAIDTALWDLKAKILDLPLCSVLGRVHERVPIYGSGGFTSLTDDELSQQLHHWAIDLAIPRVKMKIASSSGAEEDRDVHRVEVARNAIGHDTDLFVDANGGYTRKQAVRLANTFEELGVTWFEEPVSSDDLEGLHEVRTRTTADVAAGEYGYDLAYFQRLTAASAVDVVQADVSRCAGVTDWLRIAAVAAAHGLDISGHCAPLLHLHPACATPNVRHLEYFADHVRADQLLFDGCAKPDAGTLTPDLTRPGIGLTLNTERATRYLKEDF